MRYREGRKRFLMTSRKASRKLYYGLPSSVTMLEHCGEQQGANKQHMVETGPDMPDPGPEIFDKLV